jgi:hypothetical protein
VTVLDENLYASEHSARAAYQDRWEILRDPSPVRTLPLSEMLHLFSRCGIGRRLLEDDLQRDLSGTRPFRSDAGQLFFHLRTVILSGRKNSA